MKDTDLIAALRQMKVNTKSLACLGCGYEDRCSTKGCRLLGLAADHLAAYGQAVETIKAMHTAASGDGKSLLRDVISLFDPAYGNPTYSQNYIVRECSRNIRSDPFDAIMYAAKAFPMRKHVTDFERCADTAELADTLRCIDDNGYYMSGVTQDGSGVYTVFFRRPASE